MLSRLLATAALLLLSPLALAQPVAGTDYFAIDPPQPVAGDKIEVVEVFGYPCIHCANAAPVIKEWSKGLGPDVKLSFVPAVFGGVWEAFGRAFYTAETMGVMEKTHDRLFEVVHTEKRQFRNLDDIASFYADYGVSKETFLGTMTSFPVNAKISQAVQQVQAWGVDSTPTIVVNGKYRVQARGGEDGYEKMMQVVDFLINEERKAKKAG
jgi:protein dithiol oxidoreductase (disulfide-forming)